MFFPENFVIFLNSASSAAALVFYLPGVCTHTDTERKQSPKYFKIFKKNTIIKEHAVPRTKAKEIVAGTTFSKRIVSLQTID